MGRHNSLSGGKPSYTLTWTPHIDHIKKRAPQWMGMVGPLLNRKIDLSVRYGVLLYMQLIPP